MPQTPRSGTEAEKRAARLQAALRDNLRRRKASADKASTPAPGTAAEKDAGKA